MALDLQSQINVYWYAAHDIEWQYVNEFAGGTPIQIFIIQRAIQLMCGQMVRFHKIARLLPEKTDG